MSAKVSAEDRARLRNALSVTGPDLLRYFERRTRWGEDAADLLAETMLQAWRRIEKLPADAEAQRMWLFTIAGYMQANHRRATKRRVALTERLKQQRGQDAHVQDSAATVEVRDAVRRLPPAQRELVILIHWDGFTIAQAAELVGINASTARSRYASARETLKRILREDARP